MKYTLGSNNVKVILTNIGNPHALGQRPITFLRQVLALTSYPDLLEMPEVLKHFPSDVVERAKAYLANMPGGTGAYQDSKGNPFVVKEVAQFITARDENQASPADIFLDNGASPIIQKCMRIIIRDKNDGILLPVPQYPLYSATVVMMGGTVVDYPLRESEGWSLSIEDLQRVTDEARGRGIVVRALSIVNPGNPTGQVLTRTNLEAIVRWCYRERIVLLADEVYQANIYSDIPFVSAHKVLREMQDVAGTLECLSFHTISKGVFGECGRRGGYVHCTNLSADFKEQLYKVMSTNLSSNADGQVCLGLMCNPPRPGQPSYPLYKKEYDTLAASLKKRAGLISQLFNDIPGMSCNHVTGAMYAFPKITIPMGAVEAAKKRKIAPDVLYCLELLDSTGISVVPGSGFGQEDGTFHFRTTILPQEDVMNRILKDFRAFHIDFNRRYSRSSKL